MTGAQIRVLHVISDLEIGGAQEVVRTLVKYQASNECLPMVCSFKDGPLRHEIERLGFKVEILAPPRHSIVFFPGFITETIRLWRSLSSFVTNNNIDIIQTHLLRSLDFLVLFLKYSTPVKIVFWTFHSVELEIAKSQLSRHRWLWIPKKIMHRFLYRMTSCLVTGLIAVSDEVKTAILHVFGPIQNKITVIYNGVDIKRYEIPIDKMQIRSQLGFNMDSRLIAVLATLKEEKGHRFIIDAMKSVTSRYGNVQTLFIGDGPQRFKLQEYARQSNLERHVLFLGSRRDVPQLLAACDVFVLASLYEGFSMALLEAMASGKPIVATAVSGTIKAMIAGRTGLIVPPQNSRELSNAIIQLLSNPKQACTMGRTAKRRAEDNFGAQKQADEYMVLYKSKMANHMEF